LPEPTPKTFVASGVGHTRRRRKKIGKKEISEKPTQKNGFPFTLFDEKRKQLRTQNKDSLQLRVAVAEKMAERGGGGRQGCQICLGACYQHRKNYLRVIKYPKCLKNTPNVHKIYKHFPS
jgi:hypothetical protein